MDALPHKICRIAGWKTKCPSETILYGFPDNNTGKDTYFISNTHYNFFSIGFQSVSPNFS
jgi:hypothetical protein